MNHYFVDCMHVQFVFVPIDADDLVSVVLRKRKVKLETRIRRRRDGTREPSRCCTVSRYNQSYYCTQ